MCEVSTPYFSSVEGQGNCADMISSCRNAFIKRCVEEIIAMVTESARQASGVAVQPDACAAYRSHFVDRVWQAR